MGNIRGDCEHAFVIDSGARERFEAANCLIGRDLSDYEIARRTGMSRSTVQRWRTQGPPRRIRDRRPTRWRPSDTAGYCYLLGVYLGDGYVGKLAESPVLEIALDARYPGVVKEVEAAIQVVSGAGPRVNRRISRNGESIRITRGGWIWPLAFPQSGSGKKHERQISLVGWQQAAVDRHPRQFIRGLLHSDGSRCVNRFSVELPGGQREYAYVRYFFTNLSTDIQRLFCGSCDRLGIHWTQSSYKNISIAQRSSVALLDSFVGPKS